MRRRRSKRPYPPYFFSCAVLLVGVCGGFVRVLCVVFVRVCMLKCALLHVELMVFTSLSRPRILMAVASFWIKSS